MQNIQVQVIYGAMFVDLIVKATGWEDAKQKARAEVYSNEDLKAFRRHFTNYVVA